MNVGKKKKKEKIIIVSLKVKIRTTNLPAYQSQYCITDITLNIRLFQKVTRVPVPWNIRRPHPRSHFQPIRKNYNKVTSLIYSNNKSLFNKQSALIVLDCHMAVGLFIYFIYFYSPFIGKLLIPSVIKTSDFIQPLSQVPAPSFGLLFSFRLFIFLQWKTQNTNFQRINMTQQKRCVSMSGDVKRGSWSRSPRRHPQRKSSSWD